MQKESILRLNKDDEYSGQTKINRFSIHRLIVTSVLVTQKFYNDMYYSNQAVAGLGGIGMEELNQLEAIFVKNLNWNLLVPELECESYIQTVKNVLNQQALSDQYSMMNQPILKASEA